MAVSYSKPALCLWVVSKLQNSIIAPSTVHNFDPLDNLIIRSLEWNFAALIIHWERHRRQMGYWHLCILLTYDIKKAEHLHTKDDNASKTTKRDEHKVSVTASQWHNWPKLLSHFQILYCIWIWIFVYPHNLVAGISKERKIWICMVVLFNYHLKVI